LNWTFYVDHRVSPGVAVAKRERELTSSASAALKRVRTAAATLAHVEESVSFGNPTFRINRKAFAVIDRYEGRDCLWLRVDAADRERLLKNRGWFPSPYDPRQTALCCALDQFDWVGLRSMLRASYDLAVAQPRKVAK
jgi:predicted DNA-binding protein (MmcQ/YjbR family)